MWSQCEELLKKAIEINPKNDAAYVDLAACYYDNSEMWSQQSEELLRKAIEINPKNNDAYVDLAAYYRSLGDSVRQVELLEKAIEIDPGNYEAYFDLGEYYHARGEYYKSGDLYQKILKTDPSNYEAVARLIKYCEMEESDRRQASYHNILVMEPEDNAVCIEFRNHYNRFEDKTSITQKNYRKIKEILDIRGATLVAVQYPMRNIETLKATFENRDGIIFVDNENVFREAVRQGNYDEYFGDKFACNFGHCTPKGNKLLAENIASVIWKLIQETVKASK